LFNDGVNLGVGLVNQHVFGIDEADAFPVSPAALNANTAFNSPYAGSFAPLFVLAGEIIGAADAALSVEGVAKFLIGSQLFLQELAELTLESTVGVGAEAQERATWERSAKTYASK
jgi:hypothetical protein